MRKYLPLLLLLFAAKAQASAANIYITDSGSASGVCSAGVQTPAFFNNSANWGAGAAQIGAGTVVHLCGTFTGTANTTKLTAQGNGANGNPIIILGDTGVNFTAPYWAQGTGAINLAGRSDITLDGGGSACGYVGGVDTSCNGTIQDSANGTGRTFQATSTGIGVQSTTRVTVQHWNIINIYVHSGLGSDCCTGGASETNNAISGYNTTVHNNLTIQNNYIHDCSWCVDGYGNNYTVKNNAIFNMNHGISLGNGQNGFTLVAFSINHNHIHDMGNWDTADNKYHHDGIHMWGQSGGIINSGSVDANLFDGDIGNNNTGWIFAENTVKNVVYSNNVFITNSGRINNNGAIGLAYQGDPNVSGNSVLNNTVVDHNFNTSGSTCYAAHGQVNLTFKNNIAMGCNTVFYDDNSNSGLSVDWNLYDNSGAGNGNTFSKSGTGSTGVFATWKGWCGCDANSQFVSSASINLNTSTWQPQTGSAAILHATNLTGLGIAALDVDKNGIARPGAGNWDNGAIQSGTAPPPPPPGPPPVIVQLPINVLPLPASGPIPTLSKLSPGAAYLSSKGFSQDGKAFTPTLTVTATGTNLCGLCFTLDGTAIPANCLQTTSCTMSLPSTVSVATHMIGVTGSVVLAPVLQ